jgi:amino acid transporter
LDPRRRTPVNSIFFVAALVMGLILLSLMGVEEQESQQLLTMASIVHYAIAYVALFALPLAGRAALRSRLPLWLKIAAGGGLLSSLVALSISLYPIVNVVSRAAFAAKICAVVVVSNMAGLLIYRIGTRGKQSRGPASGRNRR